MISLRPAYPFRPLRPLCPGLFGIGLLSLASGAPSVVPLGKGSYASEPPAPNAQLAAFLQGPDRLESSLGPLPYPSNDIWSFGIWSNEKENFGFGRPYRLPLAVQVRAWSASASRPRRRRRRGRFLSCQIPARAPHRRLVHGLPVPR